MPSKKVVSKGRIHQSILRNPSPPPGMDNEGREMKIYFYKPETNPIVRMMSEEIAASRGINSIVHLLDQFLLQTPLVSEDEEESVKEPVKEPGEIVSPAKVKIEETEADRCMEVDVLVVEGPLELQEPLSDLITQEKKQKILDQQVPLAEKKKKRQDKPDQEKKKKKQCMHSGIKNKTASAQNKSFKLSPENSSSNSSSPTFDILSQRHSLSRSLKRPKSPSVGRKRRKSLNRHRSTSLSPDLDTRRSGRKSPRYLSPTRWRKSPSRYSPRSPSSRRRSPIRWSPIRRSRRSPRRGSSIRRSPIRCRSSSSSPDLPRSYRPRSPSVSSRRRSPSVSSRRRSPSVSSRRRSPSVFSRYGSRPQSGVPKRYGSVSPVRVRVGKSPIRAPIQAPIQKSLVPYGERSESSSHSSGEEHLPARLMGKGSLDKTQKTAVDKPEIKRLVVPMSKFKNFPVEDEYSQILAEEMKKRQLIQDSDEDPGVIGEKTAAVATVEEVPVKTEPVCAEKSVPVPEDQENLVNREFGPHPSDMQPETSVPQTKCVKKEDIKSEFPEQKEGCLLNSYYCQACQLGLNSELTWQSHINGKKHGKMLKLQTVHEIAKGSIAIPSTPAVVSEDIPRFADAAPGRKRYPVIDMARLTPAIDDVKNLPIPGLDFIQEIVSEMDVNYYCGLCDAPCGPSSIMPHLIGYKHQLRCLREISPDRYEKNKHRAKKSFESVLITRLRGHERRYGRGTVRVYKEEDDPTTRPFYEYPGPSSWRNTSSIPYIKKEFKEDGETEIPINDECLDTSKGDFFCKLCDSHMNNVNMWEAHVRGKRHLKNAKKIPGENISKLKSVKVPNAQSHLEEMIAESHSHNLIVGLDFIKETRGINGEIYNCFLCGSCSTNYDIIQHILLPKHRLRYLEKLVTEGKFNTVTTISQMEFQAPYYREILVDSECKKMVDLYGPGRVEVYVSKS